MRAFIILPCSLFYMCRLIKNDTNFQKEVRNFDTSKNFFKKNMQEKFGWRTEKINRSQYCCFELLEKINF